MRSLQRRMYGVKRTKIPAKGITTPELGGLFGENAKPDSYKANGTIYVLRSNSEAESIQQNRSMIHKIGVTITSVEKRIASAEDDPTYLCAPVEIVATYDLYGIDPVKLENLIHQFFGAVQLDLEVKDRFGKVVKPREWFLVPLNVIDEFVQHLQKGDLVGRYYNPATCQLEQKSS